MTTSPPVRRRVPRTYLFDAFEAAVIVIATSQALALLAVLLTQVLA